MKTESTAESFPDQTLIGVLATEAGRLLEAHIKLCESGKELS